MPLSNPGTAPPPLDANQLALDRTRLAHERTLLAWIRTATGLITFGFSIHKFFQFQHDTAGVAAQHRLIGPREFAIGTITLGLVALLMATWEHTANTRALRAQDPRVPRSLAGLFGALISVLGLLGLFSAIFRQ
jgi:putative membrane protein